MSQRSTRRRRHKKLSRSTGRLRTERLRREAARLLAELKAEARHRAPHLTAPAAWSLVTPTLKAEAQTLDPTGDLLAELHRLIAEAVARAADEPLVAVGKPAAERKRLGR
jgi:hypothetical protein